MIELLHYDFMQYALTACFFAAVICAVAGAMAVVNRYVYIAGGVAHASYGGIGFALWAGFPPLWGALGVAAGMGLFLGWMKVRDERKVDAFVSALWAMGMAGGVLLTDLTPGYATDYLSYLFGNILLVTPQDLIASGVFAFFSAVVAVKYYRALLAVSADQDYAATLGYNIRVINLVMLVFLCVAVVLVMRIAGLILVMALISIPASIAESHTKRLSRMMVLSFAIAAAAIYAGLIAAAMLNLTPAAAIVALLALAYLFNIAFLRRKGK